MCCTPTITFDERVTLYCGRCGKEFTQPLPESGTQRIIDQLIVVFEEHAQSAHDCLASPNSLEREQSEF